jgi:arylsulfatase A-like enzyme
MVHPKKSPDIYLIPKKYWTWSYRSGTSHGSPYDYDSHIPFIIANGSREGSVSTIKVKSVDIGPTIAKSLNIFFPSNLDGEPIPFK